MLHESGRGTPASTPMLARSGTRLIASTPQATADLDGVGRDEPGDQVGGLLGRPALASSVRQPVPVRQAGVQPGGAGDVVGLFAGLGHAAAEDLLDGARVDAGAVDERALGRAEQVGGVQAGQPAAALADRRAHRFDDHRRTHRGSSSVPAVAN